jgi:hypothetical protein
MLLSQVESRRTALTDVTVLAAADLESYWSTIVDESPQRVAAGLREATPQVVAAYGDVAGEMAADWYATARPSASGFSPTPVTPPGSATVVQDRLSWALAPIMSGDAPSVTWERVAGVLYTSVAAFDRTTVSVNADRDAASTGWRRQARADACAFCAYMASMVDNVTPVPEASTYHDHCRCIPVPLFIGEPDVEQPGRDGWIEAFNTARSDILSERQAIPGYSSLRRGERYRKYPDLQINTSNLLARARRSAGLK